MLCLFVFDIVVLFVFFFLCVLFFFFYGFFFFQAEDGIRDLVRSRGLGDVYKRQAFIPNDLPDPDGPTTIKLRLLMSPFSMGLKKGSTLSLIHI